MLINPTIFTVPLGFIGAYLGTVLSSRKKTEKGSFEEVLFKSTLDLELAYQKNIKGAVIT
ncbi:hypothetical protein ABE288_09960 [Bacillus salipaludis]|uniref:hypothetical protein n=1 Tax=Bacillus salipaludis TaxID=2547811 RepID=UPI003D1A1753